MSGNVDRDFGAPGYGGPCPPQGHGPHRYAFTVFAVKEAALPVAADTSAAIVGFQLHFNTLAKATRTGKFERLLEQGPVWTRASNSVLMACLGGDTHHASEPRGAEGSV